MVLKVSCLCPPTHKFLNKESFRCRFPLFLLSGELVINSFCEGREVTKEFLFVLCVCLAHRPHRGKAELIGCAFSFCISH